MKNRQTVAHYASIATAVFLGISYFANQLADFLSRFVAP